MIFDIILRLLIDIIPRGCGLFMAVYAAYLVFHYPTNGHELLLALLLFVLTAFTWPVEIKS